MTEGSIEASKDEELLADRQFSLTGQENANIVPRGKSTEPTELLEGQAFVKQSTSATVTLPPVQSTILPSEPKAPSSTLELTSVSTEKQPSVPLGSKSCDQRKSGATLIDDRTNTGNDRVTLDCPPHNALTSTVLAVDPELSKKESEMVSLVHRRTQNLSQPSQETIDLTGSTESSELSSKMHKENDISHSTTEDGATLVALKTCSTSTVSMAPVIVPVIEPDLSTTTSGVSTQRVEKSDMVSLEDQSQRFANFPLSKSTASVLPPASTSVADYRIQQARAPLIDLYGPYFLDSDTSLLKARDRLKMALRQAYQLRTAFTKRVYEKYRVCLKPPSPVSSTIDKIYSEPKKWHEQLEQERSKLAEERQVEKKLVTVTPATAASHLIPAQTFTSPESSSEWAEFYSAGLHLVLLPEDDAGHAAAAAVCALTKTGTNAETISSYCDRGPINSETGQRVRAISAAAAAAAESLLERVRHAVSWRFERQRQAYARSDEVTNERELSLGADNKLFTSFALTSIDEISTKTMLSTAPTTATPLAPSLLPSATHLGSGASKQFATSMEMQKSFQAHNFRPSEIKNALSYSNSTMSNTATSSAKKTLGKTMKSPALLVTQSSRAALSTNFLLSIAPTAEHMPENCVGGSGSNNFSRQPRVSSAALSALYHLTKTTQQNFQHPYPESLGGRQQRYGGSINQRTISNNADTSIIDFEEATSFTINKNLLPFSSLTLPPFPCTKERLERETLPILPRREASTFRAHYAVHRVLRQLVSESVDDQVDKLSMPVTKTQMLQGLRVNDHQHEGRKQGSSFSVQSQSSEHAFVSTLQNSSMSQLTAHSDHNPIPHLDPWVALNVLQAIGVVATDEGHSNHGTSVNLASFLLDLDFASIWSEKLRNLHNTIISEKCTLTRLLVIGDKKRYRENVSGKAYFGDIVLPNLTCEGGVLTDAAVENFNILKGNSQIGKKSAVNSAYNEPPALFLKNSVEIANVKTETFTLNNVEDQNVTATKRKFSDPLSPERSLKRKLLDTASSSDDVEQNGNKERAEFASACIDKTAPMSKLRLDSALDRGLCSFQLLVQYLDEARLCSLRAKSQERVMLATLLGRKVTMLESFAHAYTSAVVRAGEAFGHGKLFEIVQNEECSVSSMIPYDIFTGEGEAWEDPCRPPTGFTSGLTGDELFRRAHARAMIQKSLRKLQDRHHIQGGTNTHGAYVDFISCSGPSAPDPGNMSPRPTLKRKRTFPEISDPTGTGFVPAKSWTTYEPTPISVPLDWESNLLENTPYGLHRLGERTRSLSLSLSSRSGEPRNLKKSKRSTSVITQQQPFGATEKIDPDQKIPQSTTEITWAEVAGIFQRVDVLKRSPSSKTGGPCHAKLSKNIFAPYCQKVDLVSSSVYEDESDTSEDLREETVLARHQVVLDEMKAKLSAFLEARNRQHNSRKSKLV